MRAYCLLSAARLSPRHDEAMSRPPTRRPQQRRNRVSRSRLVDTSTTTDGWPLDAWQGLRPALAGVYLCHHCGRWRWRRLGSDREKTAE